VFFVCSQTSERDSLDENAVVNEDARQTPQDAKKFYGQTCTYSDSCNRWDDRIFRNMQQLVAQLRHQVFLLFPVSAHTLMSLLNHFITANIKCQWAMSVFPSTVMCHLTMGDMMW